MTTIESNGSAMVGPSGIFGKQTGATFGLAMLRKNELSFCGFLEVHAGLQRHRSVAAG
jgi:hypothetical protein